MTTEQSAADEMVERGVDAYIAAEEDLLPPVACMEEAISAMTGVNAADLARLAPEITRLASGEAVCVPVEAVCVPVEPTDEMLIAGVNDNPTMWTDDTDSGFPAEVAASVFAAMIAARPQPGSASDGQ